MKNIYLTDEFKRIDALPRIDYQKVGTEWCARVQDALRTPRGTMVLKPWQAAALVYALEHGGLFTSAGVGAGKTLVSLLAPVMLDALRPLLMLPAAAREKTHAEIPGYRRHFTLHPYLQILSYEELSRLSGVDALYALRPDLIIADEAHRLKDLSTARGRRWARYFKDHPSTKLIAMTGTPTTTSVHEYAHHVRFALRDGAPLPRTHLELEDWAAVLDAKPRALVGPGPMRRWCEGGENVRQAWQRRLGETPGIILTTAPSSDAKINFERREIPVPRVIKEALAKLYSTWATPGGEECRYPMELWRHGRELSCGFYYRWVWPRGVINQRWMDARAAWFKFVRNTIKYGRLYDSPKAVENAVVAGALFSDEWCNWLDVRDEYVPVTTPVWLSDFLVDDVIAQARAPGRNALVWVEHSAFGARLRRKGFPYMGPEATQREIVEFPGSVAVSQKAHREIKNLQNRADNIVVSPSSSGAEWEQMIGRTHRQGQTADTVRVTVYAHTDAFRDSMQSAYDAALYMKDSMGQQQKILMGGFLG